MAKISEICLTMGKFEQMFVSWFFRTPHSKFKEIYLKILDYASKKMKLLTLGKAVKTCVTILDEIALSRIMGLIIETKTEPGKQHIKIELPIYNW